MPGKRNVTRHSNILAYLFLPCNEKQKKDIYEKVILNDEVAQITTPYFKFYENQVHCLAGNGMLLEESIRKSGKVPVPGGCVQVSMNKKELRVKTDVPGGILWIGEKKYTLEPGVEFIGEYENEEN